MKVYEGGRSLDGAVVTVDGVPLDPRFDIHRFSRMGFEWTYEGDGPRQLALALLADHLGDPQRALALTEAFMRSVVAELDNAWRLTGADIDAALREHGAAAIPDRCHASVDTEMARLRLCRPTLADVPALFRFLGDPAGDALHPC